MEKPVCEVEMNTIQHIQAVVDTKLVMLMAAIPAGIQGLVVGSAGLLRRRAGSVGLRQKAFHVRVILHADRM